ncbi:exodeoxyribonuclease VII large subunit [Helicobacter acinonychis]|uniref:exodeoxyribonuclease VII large subunit n=1 Tax=Helicobacter acinonychis TaxID=212 RepID=UPI000CF0B5A1|nr:exodeoxyribonuclease VII large subunit [Helicobacter acinonychis]STP03654.1 exodeoxyribonuclease VII large subunit [Helicobacter acinonychis]
MDALSVSEINAKIKALLEATFLQVRVQGEVSNLTIHKVSGHAYFSLKDSQSVIRCTLFRGNASKLKFALKEGQEVAVFGAISVYPPRGDYQINCFEIEPKDWGSLALALEQLKEKLRLKGYFDKENKLPKPSFPKRVAIITSQNSAAWADMQKIAFKRWPMCELVCINTLMQGEGCVQSVVESIAYADSFYNTRNAFDAIVVARGGGSMEDLYSFNDERIADALYLAKTFSMSAIGHESDFLLSDSVADLRASTPSNAMEILLPSSEEWQQKLDGFNLKLQRSFKILLHQKKVHLEHLAASLKRLSFENKHHLNSLKLEKLKIALENKTLEFLRLKKTLLEKISTQLSTSPFLQTKTERLNALDNALKLAHAHLKLPKFGAFVSKNNQAIELEELKIGDKIELNNEKARASAAILSVDKA